MRWYLFIKLWVYICSLFQSVFISICLTLCFRPHVSSPQLDYIQPHSSLCVAELGASAGAQWSGDTVRLQDPRPHHTHRHTQGTLNFTHQKLLHNNNNTHTHFTHTPETHSVWAREHIVTLTVALISHPRYHSAATLYVHTWANMCADTVKRYPL